MADIPYREWNIIIIWYKNQLAWIIQTTAPSPLPSGLIRI
jgi:hypothetical protein